MKVKRKKIKDEIEESNWYSTIVLFLSCENVHYDSSLRGEKKESLIFSNNTILNTFLTW